MSEYIVASSLLALASFLAVLLLLLLLSLTASKVVALSWNTITTRVQ